MTHEKDYILGTHDDEIVRLGLQHRVWRPRALDAWRRAGFTTGQTCKQRALGNITTVELDLDESELPTLVADGAWSRWVFAFVKDPRKLLARVSSRLKHGCVKGFLMSVFVGW